ncbi:potassium transporter 5-like [Durio zibethinus]|uniref:Potassium transporter n=1 Tax=Durio zibethinus TaxID=66656 RepID=A0A6P6AY73_DURZI|nr:potassium transporter 5-like [Durio zibethinus]
MSSDVVLVQNPIEETRHEEVFDHQDQPKKQKSSFEKLRRHDSLDLESATVPGHHDRGSQRSVILQLAFQSIGVVYGDIGTSPLYVYAGIFPSGIKNKDDILGVLSLIFYTITLILLIKYVFIVLRANDNGEGGTFALYSLICRYAKAGLIPSQQAEDYNVSKFKLELPSNRLKRASRLKSMLENSNFAKIFLLLVAMLGTSMVIGDGILTPCISVLSAVGGIKEKAPSMTEGRIVGISVAILVCLFMFQRFGTDKVGYSFAPILCIWFAFIGGIGIYNLFKFDPTVVKAINPKYIIDYFKRNKKDAWVSLGGVVLAITGAEALFADVGHFTVRSIQISTCTVTYPAIMLAYIGQASFLRKHEDLVPDAFYKSVPGPLFWPMFVVAVAAAIIASQAMISGSFSIIHQSLSLGCFPRVKVVHTSTKYEGQVYIPEVNYLLMLACIGVTAGFKTSNNIGNAYGIAVIFVMSLTSSLLVVVMIMIWKTNILFVIAYVLTIGSVELIYLSSVLYKIDQGGYLPLAFAAVLMIVMYIWNNVYRRKYYYEVDHKISSEKLKNTNFTRIPGLAMFYSELVQGIPPIFGHYLENVSALHSVLVFISIKSLPISRVPIEERFLFRRVEPRELNVFRCVVRYGYTDVHNERDSFEKTFLERLKEFIKKDTWLTQMQAQKGATTEKDTELEDGFEHDHNAKQDGEGEQEEVVRKEIELVEQACQAGVVHLVGETDVIAGKGAGVGKKFLIDYAYNFMKKNLRQTDKVFEIPHNRLLKVGMTYEL